MKIAQKIFFLLIVLLGFTNIYAQDIPNIDVTSLSKEDIQKAKKEMQAAGLTIEQAANIARKKGATEEQIKLFRERLEEDGEVLTNANVQDSIFMKKGDQKENQQNFDQREKPPLAPSVSKIFGSYLFNSKNLTFEPELNIQTPKNYEIGIGDQMLIHIWGNSQNNYQLEVNKSGQIIIPDVGPIYVAGLTFDDAEKKIKKRLTEIYADMRGNTPETFAQINMGQLRSIQVNIVGEAVMPGTYTLPATATVFNGLYLSGGPGEIGSFRNIKVIRNNKTYKTVDIYDFLINADPKANITLQDGDIVFIPPVEKQIDVTGEFKRNALFELKDGEMLNNLVRFAGGYTPNAHLGNIQIYRKTQQGQEIFDIAYDDISSTPLENGDSISNTQIIDIFKNRVAIVGAVYHPGSYEWKQGLTLSQLIVKADSLTRDAFKTRGMITRCNKDLTTSSIVFDVQKIVSGQNDILLQPDDSVFVKSIFDLREDPIVSINGEVQEPGEFHWADKLTLGDAIFMAGGLTEGADSTYIEIARRLSYKEASRLSDTLAHVIIANVSRNLKIGTNDTELKLQPFDEISIRRAPNYRRKGTAFITGEVKYAGAYAINNKQLRISDLLQMAGGLTPQAYTKGATLERFSEELGSEHIAINLQKLLDNPRGESDILLCDGDRVNIPVFLQTVKITGSVQNPFSLTYEPGKKAKYYIDRSGGFDAKAQKRKTYVQYPNGSTAVTKSFIIKSYPKVTPGSMIVVPEKPEKDSKKSSMWLAIASTLGSLAVSAATIISVTK